MQTNRDITDETKFYLTPAEAAAWFRYQGLAISAERVREYMALGYLTSIELPPTRRRKSDKVVTRRYQPRLMTDKESCEHFVQCLKAERDKKTQLLRRMTEENYEQQRELDAQFALAELRLLDRAAREKVRETRQILWAQSEQHSPNEQETQQRKAQLADELYEQMLRRKAERRRK